MPLDAAMPAFSLTFSRKHGMKKLAHIALLSLALLSAAGLAGAATVQQFQPQGKVADQTRITARFSAEMVKLGDTSAAGPFELDCQNIAGEGRWVDSRTWAWQLSRPLQPGERCIFSAKSGYTSPTGETFSGKNRFELQGAAPRPWRIVPAAGQPIEEDQAFVINGGSALDAVALAVSLLEDCPLFNAGHGAVFTRDETHELDAAVMDGDGLRAGAVACVTRIKHPVYAARAVMEKTSHVLLVGAGAETFARLHALEMVEPAYFSTDFRREQLQRARAEGRTLLDHDGGHAEQKTQDEQPLDEKTKFGTVGAVALDAHGHLAAATSTGGMTNKLPGRVGDSPLIGAGTYADDRYAAISCTGSGEMFIRAATAYDVCARMAYAGQSLHEAAHAAIERRAVVGDQAVDRAHRALEGLHRRARAVQRRLRLGHALRIDAVIDAQQRLALRAEHVHARHFRAPHHRPGRHPAAPDVAARSGRGVHAA